MVLGRFSVRFAPCVNVGWVNTCVCQLQTESLTQCCAAPLQVMVVLKYIFQFGFFSWNSAHEMTVNKDRPFFPPRILGLEKTDNYLRYDLLQLLALFFHRALLMVCTLNLKSFRRLLNS